MATSQRLEITALDELERELKSLLENGSLFRTIEYPAAIHKFSATTSNYVHLPKLISRYCGRCAISTLWENGSNSFEISNVFALKSYRCRNCEKREVHFAIAWWRAGENVLFEKFGEYPKPEISIPTILEERLGKDDSSLYRRALISANISHGLAAVGYARRVVENRVDTLLELIAESARLSGASEPELSKVEEVKASRQVDRKIELASVLLPSHLRPGGHNPIVTLYSNLSDALHNKSDAECLTVFEEFRFIFEYLFRNLTTENTEAEAFAKRFSAKVSKPQESKSRGQ